MSGLCLPGACPGRIDGLGEEGASSPLSEKLLALVLAKRLRPELTWSGVPSEEKMEKFACPPGLKKDVSSRVELRTERPYGANWRRRPPGESCNQDRGLAMGL